MMPILPAPGSKVRELAAKIEAGAWEAAQQTLPASILADSLFRQKLREHCLAEATARIAEPVQ